jgi:hypothetical protein
MLDNLEHQVHADRKVRAINEAYAALFYYAPRFIDLIVPSRSAHDYGHAVESHQPQVLKDSIRLGEIYRYVCLFEIAAGADHRVYDRGDLYVVLGGSLLDDLPHLAVTDKRYLHN